MTFARAADAYLEFKDRAARHPDIRRLRRLKRALGHAKLVRDVVHADLVAAAKALKPDGTPATRNREVIGPAAAVLHYAAENGWRGWLRIKRFKEPRPATRAAAPEVPTLLLANLPAPKHRDAGLLWHRRLLVLWLFRQGDRVSDPLRVEWPQIDLEARNVTLRIGKGDRWRIVPLDDQVWECLANAPAEVERDGPLFPWETRSGVYAWLRPLVRRLGIAFTPHMARHSLGKALNDAGEGLRTIMDTLGHADAKSSMRYQAGDIEVVRAAKRKLARIG